MYSAELLYCTHPQNQIVSALLTGEILPDNFETIQIIYLIIHKARKICKNGGVCAGGCQTKDEILDSGTFISSQ